MTIVYLILVLSLFLATFRWADRTCTEIPALCTLFTGFLLFLSVLFIPINHAKSVLFMYKYDAAQETINGYRETIKSEELHNGLSERATTGRNIIDIMLETNQRLASIKFWNEFLYGFFDWYYNDGAAALPYLR